MDIKENFYAKLEQLREDYSMKDAKKSKFYKNQAKTSLKISATGDVSKRRKKKELSRANKEHQLSQKYAKSAVTGLDEEQLDELRGKSSLSDDGKKKLKGRIYKKHGKAWDDTIDIRKEKKSSGPADTRDMDKYRNRLAKMYNKLEEGKDSYEKYMKRMKGEAGNSYKDEGKWSKKMKREQEKVMRKKEK